MKKSEKFSAFEKEKFSKAQELSKSGDLHGALEVLQELVIMQPTSAVLCATLAGIYWELDDLKEAENNFRNAVELAPGSETSSLGLFHCLWEQDRKDEAFEEMKRFQSVSYSKDYEDIVKEINEDVTKGPAD